MKNYGQPSQEDNSLRQSGVAHLPGIVGYSLAMRNSLGYGFPMRLRRSAEME